MISGNFRLRVVIRVLLLAVLIAMLVYSLLRSSWYITPVVLLGVTLAVVAELVWYVEKTNKEFTAFLLAIKSSDFSRHSGTGQQGKSFTDFKAAMNIIVEAFQQTRIDREADYILLQSIVQHITTSIIVYNGQGEVLLINHAAEKLLYTRYLRNIYTLNETNPQLLHYLLHLPDANNIVLETEINGEPVKLLARATCFIRQGVAHTLVSVQNINVVIENSELEAWEQMLRVLTHEIMNSITPISSLSGVLRNKMEQVAGQQKIHAEMLDDLCMGIKVIEQRSVGLVHFVHQYKSLISLPQPCMTTVNVKDLLDRVCLLAQEQLLAMGIVLQLQVSSYPIFIQADEGQIEQVLLNLVNNAVDACKNNATPHIQIASWVFEERSYIRVTDNGNGIASENMGKIFIPFFTTKKKGSGIGLSLSKQIMKLHKGFIKVSASSANGTSMMLDFPAG